MKVVYFAYSLAHKRVLESFREVDFLEQIMVVPKPQITSNVIPEGYKDFSIKNIITYGSIKEANKIIKKLHPDVLAQTTTGRIIDVSSKTKRVYISHGIVGNHVKFLSKFGTANTWKDFDMYCGLTKVFEDWINHATGKKQKVITNALPQLDLLANKKYASHYKNNILKITKNPTPEKVILFCGFCCKDRNDFALHNEDYFASATELEKISKKHNFLTLIKPRHPYAKMMGFLNQHKGAGWPKKYIQSYPAIQNSKYLHFITTNSHIYRYFFADLFVCNGCSSVELEACVINKPLVLVRTKVNKKQYDPFETVSSGAATQVTDIKNLESAILECFNSDSYIDKQNALIKKFNIISDGKAYERIQKEIVTL